MEVCFDMQRPKVRLNAVSMTVSLSGASGQSLTTEGVSSNDVITLVLFT